MKKSAVLLLSFIFLFAFTLLSKYEDRAILRDLDFAVTVKLQDRIDRSAHLRLSGFVGNVMEGATFFASPEFSIFALLFITGITFMKRKKMKLFALVLPAAFALLTLVEMYGKSIVHHPSPPFFMIKNPTTVFPTYYVNEQFSYPSGHAARALFLALSIWFLTMKQLSNEAKRKKLWLSLGLGFYVAIVSISRIYLGHHWMSDVVGGWLLGGALGFIGGTFLRI